MLANNFSRLQETFRKPFGQVSDFRRIQSYSEFPLALYSSEVRNLAESVRKASGSLPKFWADVSEMFRRRFRSRWLNLAQILSGEELEGTTRKRSPRAGVKRRRSSRRWEHVRSSHSYIMVPPLSLSLKKLEMSFPGSLILRYPVLESS